MKAIAFIPRSQREPIPQNINEVLTENDISYTIVYDVDGCRYVVADEDYATAVALIDDPYKVVE